MVRPKAILSRAELEAATEFAARAGLSLEQWLYALAVASDREAPEPVPPPREAPRPAGDAFARSRFFSEPRRPYEPRHAESSIISETRGLLEASEQRTADALAKLLGWVENSASRTEGEISRIAETCGKISDNVRSSLDAINQRISTVENTVRSGSAGAIPDLLQRIERKIAQLETSRQPEVDPAELSEAFAEFEQRLDGIARYMEDTQRTSAGQAERLNVVETALTLALKRMEAASEQQAEAQRSRAAAPEPHDPRWSALAAAQADRGRDLQEVQEAIRQLQGSISVAVPRLNAAAESVLSSVASAIPPELRAVPHRIDALDRQLGALGQKVDPLTRLDAEIPGIRADLARLSSALQPDLPSKLEALEESVNAIIDSVRRVDDTYRESRTANDSIVELIGRIGEIQSTVEGITARLPADPALPPEMMQRLERIEQAIRTGGFDTLVEDATHRVAANLSDHVAETIRSVFDTFERNTRCDTILNTINARLTEVLQSPELARAKTEQVAAAAMAQAVAQAAAASQAKAAPASPPAEQPAPPPPAPVQAPPPAEEDSSRLARALRAAERAREAEPASAPAEARGAKAAARSDDYVARLAQVSGGAYRQPPAMHAAATGADPATRRETQARAAPAAAATSQVLREPPSAEGLRPHAEVPPAPPPPSVDTEVVRTGNRAALPIAAASVVALMAGLGWAATTRYGEDHLHAMVDRLKTIPHAEEVLALLRIPSEPARQDSAPALDVAPPAASPSAADKTLAAAEPPGRTIPEGSEILSKERVAAAAAPTAPVPVPPVPVRPRAEPERAPFPPRIPVAEEKPPAVQAAPAVEARTGAPSEPETGPDADPDVREEKASVTGSIDRADAPAASAPLPKCPDYETAIISTGVTRCAPERPVAAPSDRSEAAPAGAAPKQRVASIAPAPAPAKPQAPHRPTLSAVEKAFFSKLLQDALVADDAFAAYDAGMRLMLGKGVPRDSKAAVRWLQLAADEGLAPAQYELGSIYELGTGIPKDIPLAMEWYEKAARGGNVRAMHNLGALLSDATAGTPDMDAAAGWFRKAAEYGVRESQYNLGFLYVRGVGVPQDLAEAYLWFSLAAAQGDANAAKKKQMVMGLLDEDSLAKAKKKVEMFQGRIPDLAANTVDLTTKPWTRKKVMGS